MIAELEGKKKTSLSRRHKITYLEMQVEPTLLFLVADKN